MRDGRLVSESAPGDVSKIVPLLPPSLPYGISYQAKTASGMSGGPVCCWQGDCGAWSQG